MLEIAQTFGLRSCGCNHWYNNNNYCNSTDLHSSYSLSVDKHQVPIGQMGNYQQYLKKLDPLRELDTGAVRTQLFGNPFKLEKPSDKVLVVVQYMYPSVITCNSCFVCNVFFFAI